MAKQRIVIIGAGFAGISMAKSFKNKKEVEVLVLDQNNFHNFQPLLYQIATGGLEPYSIAYPVRRILRGSKNIRFRMAKVDAINTTDNSLETSLGNIKYDQLIIATGSQTNFFNFSEETKKHLLSLKSVPEALDIRSFIFQNLERSLVKWEGETLDEIISIAVVGGGPAGIEVAGALAEMKKHVIPKDFPDLDVSKMQIHLYQSSPRLLKTMSEEASEKSKEFLEEMGVEVKLNARVTGYDGDLLELKTGETFKTDTVIWAAGVKGTLIEGLPNEAIAKGDRILVDEFNRVKHTQNIFAIGDVASHVTEENPYGLPMLAPVAQQQGETLAKNILAVAKGKAMKPFEYFDKGCMATIGRNKAVVDLPKFKFQGAFAWYVWMFVHIFSLVGFRNKLVAIIDWMANYFTYDRPLGLIIRRFDKK